jgi:hypothetical protein
MKMALRLIFLLLVVVPLAAWFIVKPVRVVMPSIVGLSCPHHSVCVETQDVLPAATELYDQALDFVRNKVGAMQGQPVVVFCSTQACADRFGLGARSAVTVGNMGTVIGPHAWKPYYVRHELIHHLQGQRFGVLRLMFMPVWLIEGMAYSLSEDPRVKLVEPWQQYRDQFNAWLAKVGRERMWETACQL